MALRMWRVRALWIRAAALCPSFGLSYELNSLCSRKTMLYGKLTYCSSYKFQEDIDDKLDVKARSWKIFSELQAKGLHKYSEKHTASLYQLLLDLGIKSSTIEAQLTATPDILGYSIKNWSDTCEVMVENGLSGINILQSIALYPQLLLVKPSTLRQTLLQYQEITVGKHNLLSLVIRYPALYLFPPRAVKKRMGLLSSMFPPTELKTLIRNNPNILTDKWETISKKIMYIHEEMGLEQPHLAASKALRKPLLHIKTRHQFLYRAGIYKTPNLLRDKQSHKRNASLSDIMDTSDKYFANRVARLTDLEYSVFACMMKEEEELEHSYSDDSDFDETNDLEFEEMPRHGS
ncbi:uncharacterized protein LOC121861026 isoform X2 [Homarus americanus]|uniref:Transcription termination factor 4-like n=2 Tax=Homarus americanus TaxID=6706 RepID=A0A8J5N4I1_HOMAM|nr:uncharacterized protein LOC121861026 isoform X2 [Homarus americanus]XP_042214434.1 uncharacterized protein LOC121861026 isoform X2 [Homarus americanus]XP_042214435.1 uncharacterized protein LOC121861026 isoform X2 [Homarus americanus]KAG7173135.1 Transcription termination factor 4-like [Homarus americanus]